MTICLIRTRPMKNFSTFIYTVNDFENNYGELLEISTLFSQKNEDFDDVWDSLESIEYAPSQSSVDKILNYSKSLSF